MRSLIILLLPCLVITAAGAEVADVIRLGMTARPIALGRASVSNLTDSNAVFTNPAALGQTPNPELATMYANNNDENTDSLLFQGVLPNQLGGTIGIGLIYLGVGRLYSSARDPITGRIIPGDTFDYGNYANVLSYGRRLNDKLSLGLSLNYYREAFSGSAAASATGYGGSFGLLYKLNERFQLGLASRNLFSSGMAWSTGARADIPVNTRLGGTFSYNENFSLSLDSELQSSRPLIWHCGAESRPQGGPFYLRAGIDQKAVSATGAVTNYAAGLGLYLGGIAFDYAYYQDNDSAGNSAHYFSVNLGSRAPVVKPAAPPAATGRATGETAASASEQPLKQGAFNRIIVLQNKLEKLTAEQNDLIQRMKAAEKARDGKRLKRLQVMLSKIENQMVNIKDQIKVLSELAGPVKP
jgi:hypothetical protein